MNKDNLAWLADWYAKQCNGDWEHHYGIKIDTIDNPGWSITIDLEGTTDSQIEDMPWQYVERSDKNWYGYKVEGGKFEAAGDPLRLDFLIQSFREVIT